MALPAEPIGKSALVVDDHPLYRAGLILALGPLSIRFEEAAGLLGALDALSLRRFDLVLYDWHLPDGGGCKGLVAIRQIAPDVPVVVISADADEAIEVAAHAIGASEYLPKSAEAARLREVVARVTGCGLEGPTAHDARTAAPDALGALTGRQRDVLRLMARGEPNKRIAVALGLAESTVRSHVSDILLTLGARNRTEAVVRAHRAGAAG